MTDEKPRGIELKCSIDEMRDPNAVIFGWQWTHDVYAAHALMKAIEELNPLDILESVKYPGTYTELVRYWIKERAAEILESEFGIKT